jgi:AraC-like DNA-binding protein
MESVSASAGTQGMRRWHANARPASRASRSIRGLCLLRYSCAVRRAASPDRIVFETADVCAGEFRCPTDHPAFRNSGPSSHDCVAFPRSAVLIRHGDTRIVADATVATLYNREQDYEREAISPRGDRCEWFGVSERLLRDLVAARDWRAAGSRRPIRFTHAPVDASLYLAQRRTARRVGQPNVDALWFEEAVIELIDRVLAAAYGEPARPPAVTARVRDLVHDTRCLLARDPVRPLGLAAIADDVGASMAHLSRCFRVCTGRTVHAHRCELRLRASLEALESHDRGLTQIALDHGYSSHSHFTSAFRRAFGMTPSAVRRGRRLDTRLDRCPGGPADRG